MPALIPYVVAWEPLRKFWGSRDVEQVEHTKSVWKTQIQENGDIYSFIVQNGGPTLAQALDQICLGYIETPQFASQYAYALEILCAQHGQKLPNQALANVDEPWIESTIDPIFRRWGMGMIFTMQHLLHGAWPLAIPKPQGFPFGGSIGPDEIEQALMTLRNANPPSGVDRRTIGVLGEVRGWLETAGSRRAGLVCFYY